MTNLKESGIPSLHRWYNDTRNQVTQYSHVPVHWVVESWEGWKEEKPYTSLRILKHRTLFPDHSLRKKLSIYGAVSNWSEQFDLRPNENELTSERSAGKEDSVNEEILKSANSQEVNSLVCAPRHPLASANRLQENLECFELRSRPVNWRKFASLHRSRTRQKLACATRPFKTWTHPRADPEPMQQFQEEE